MFFSVNDSFEKPGDLVATNQNIYLLGSHKEYQRGGALKCPTWKDEEKEDSFRSEKQPEEEKPIISPPRHHEKEKVVFDPMSQT